MSRLTTRDKDGFATVTSITKHIKVLEKLAYYEDLEEQLEKVYGEHNGLLETAVKSLVRHEGAEFDKPCKARLLTDEDVDKWETYKSLEEQELLLKLPCKLRRKLYDIIEFVEGVESPDIYVIDVSSIEISKDKDGLIYCIDSCDYREEDFGTTLFNSEEEALEGIRKNKKLGRIL